MRIISGTYKGKRLIAPKKLPVRPTTDMAKEALFNILNNRYSFHQLQVLDLFSGTGNISFEFGSRGAGPITAVDQHYECIKFIKKTATELELDITPVKSDVFRYLEKAPVKADIVFADPPYDFDLESFAKIPYLIFQKDALNAGGIVVVEHSKHTDLSSIEHFVEARRYGNSTFSFFE